MVDEEVDKEVASGKQTDGGLDVLENRHAENCETHRSVTRNTQLHTKPNPDSSDKDQRFGETEILPAGGSQRHAALVMTGSFSQRRKWKKKKVYWRHRFHFALFRKSFAGVTNNCL